MNWHQKNSRLFIDIDDMVRTRLWTSYYVFNVIVTTNWTTNKNDLWSLISCCSKCKAKFEKKNNLALYFYFSCTQMLMIKRTFAIPNSCLLYVVSVNWMCGNFIEPESIDTDYFICAFIHLRDRRKKIITKTNQPMQHLTQSIDKCSVHWIHIYIWILYNNVVTCQFLVHDFLLFFYFFCVFFVKFYELKRFAYISLSVCYWIKTAYNLARVLSLMHSTLSTSAFQTKLNRM